MNRLDRRVGAASVVIVLGLGAVSCGADSQGSSVSADCAPAHQVSTVKHGVLTVAAVDIPPVSSTASGSYTGVEADLLKKFAADNCLELKVSTVSFAGAIPAIQSDRADVATGGFYRTAERAQVVALSDPLYVDQLAAVSEDGASTVDDLLGHKVGTVDGYLWTQDAKDLLGADLTVYPSDVEMKADLKAGRIDIGLDSLGAASALFKGESMSIKPLAADDRIQATSEPAQIGFPLTKGNASLLEAMNDAVAAWHKDGTIKDALGNAGMAVSLADVGDPRLLK